MIDRLLRVEAYHFVAGALWRKEEHEWRCYKAAPILYWMVGKRAEEVKKYLQKRGWKYEWL